MFKNMYSIDITPEYPIFEDVLIYTATFNTVKSYNTDEVRYNPLNSSSDKYLVSLKLDAGEYDLNFDNKMMTYIL